jgi:hypothetical protein
MGAFRLTYIVEDVELINGALRAVCIMENLAIGTERGSIGYTVANIHLLPLKSGSMRYRERLTLCSVSSL